MTHKSPIDADDCALIVVDVQKSFTDKLPEAERQPLINRICWIVTVAKWLDIPIIATAEDIPRLAGVAPEIEARLPDKTTPYNKMVFEISGNPEIQDVVDRLGRRTLVLVGLETDVCVAQSALGLLERGYSVVVPKDAGRSEGGSSIRRPTHARRWCGRYSAQNIVLRVGPNSGRR